MTETSPLASMAWPHEQMRSWSEDEVTTVARTQAGLPVPGLEVSIRDEQGKEVAFDGITMGGLHVRGPWVTDQYVHGIGAEQFTEDGWFDTGDIAIGSPNGYFVIADRTKDLIKSGGEWISSVDMEAAIMGLPGVVEAAVIAIPDPKYIERPLACIVAGPEGAPSLESIRASLEARGSRDGSCRTEWSSWTTYRRPQSASSTRKSYGLASPPRRKRSRQSLPRRRVGLVPQVVGDEELSHDRIDVPLPPAAGEDPIVTDTGLDVLQSFVRVDVVAEFLRRTRLARRTDLVIGALDGQESRRGDGSRIDGPPFPCELTPPKQIALEDGVDRVEEEL